MNKPIRHLSASNKSRYDPPAGEHVIDLGFSKICSCFLGICYEFEESGRKSLLRLGPVTEVVVPEIVPSVPETEFCFTGNSVLLSDGRLLDVMTGSPTMVLPLISA